MTVTKKLHLWLIKVWFPASTFVVKIATLTNPETVKCLVGIDIIKQLIKMK